MAWVKLDNGFREHRKVLRATPAGVCLWVCGLDYCNRQPARDGFIPTEVVAVLYPMPKPLTVASKLVEAGLWEATDDGFIVHDYHDYQPTAEEAEAQREQRREAGRRGGKRRASNAQAKAKQTASESLEEIQANLKPVPGTVPGTEEPLLPSVVVGAPTAPRAVRPVKDSDSRTHRVREYFAAAYRTHMGGDYAAVYGRDGKLLKALPASFTVEALCALIDRFFATADAFSRTQAGLSIAEFVRKLPALQGQSATAPAMIPWEEAATMAAVEEANRLRGHA